MDTSMDGQLDAGEVKAAMAHLGKVRQSYPPPPLIIIHSHLLIIHSHLFLLFKVLTDSQVDSMISSMDVDGDKVSVHAPSAVIVPLV
jgi:hypothetical protein